MSTYQTPPQYNACAWTGQGWPEAPPPAYAPVPYQTNWNAYPAPPIMPPIQNDIFSEVIAEITAEDPGYAAQFGLQPIQHPAYSPPPAATMPPSAMPNVLREALANWERRKSELTAPTDITDKQMKALGRPHLIMMLRDSQAELALVKRDYEALLMGLLAGISLQGGTASQGGGAQ